jgi:hypothetical protein
MEYTHDNYSIFSGTYKLAKPSHAYLLQSIPEEINALAILYAQLNTTKYKGKSL